MTDLTKRIVRDHFLYDEKTGYLIRRKTVDKARRWAAGSVIGTKDKNGYLITHFNGRPWKVHHLVWIYHHGSKPEMIDHINRIPGDNRIENLRESTKSLNAYNTGLAANNTSGSKGVSWNRRLQKWHAYIGSKKTRRHIGFFQTLQEAKNARLNKEKEMGIREISCLGKNAA